MSEQENKLVVLAAADAFNRGDLRELRWLISGPKRWMQGLTEMRTAFPDGQVHIEELIAEGDRVVERWFFEGTHLAQFLGRQPTARRMRWSGISIYRVALGQIVERYAIVDRENFLQQLDVPPASESATEKLLPAELELPPLVVE